MLVLKGRFGGGKTKTQKIALFSRQKIASKES